MGWRVIRWWGIRRIRLSYLQNSVLICANAKKRPNSIEYGRIQRIAAKRMHDFSAFESQKKICTREALRRAAHLKQAFERIGDLLFRERLAEVGIKARVDKAITIARHCIRRESDDGNAAVSLHFTHGM